MLFLTCQSSDQRQATVIIGGGELTLLMNAPPLAQIKIETRRTSAMPSVRCRRRYLIDVVPLQLEGG